MESRVLSKKFTTICANLFRTIGLLCYFMVTFSSANAIAVWDEVVEFNRKTESEFDLTLKVKEKVEFKRDDKSFSFSAVLSQPTSELDVPAFFVYLYPKKVGQPLATLTFHDLECTGEFSPKVWYAHKDGYGKSEYGFSGIPWPETIDVVINVSRKREDGGYNHSLEFNGQRFSFSTERKVDYAMLQVLGTATITNAGFK